MQTELIIATYNKPRHLAAVLASVLAQEMRPDAVCFADDGSSEATRDVIESFARTAPMPSRHVWHPDDGFQKNRILNSAIRSSEADYLLFLDDDCFVPPSHVARHLKKSAPGRFVVGSVIRLTPERTARILDEPNVTWNGCRPDDWKPKGLNQALKSCGAGERIGGWLERVTPARARWKGGNSSAYRADILKVDGFNESLGYGGEDKELGIRLNKIGVMGVQAKYSAPIFHLDHERDYVDATVMKQNREAIQRARRGQL